MLEPFVIGFCSGVIGYCYAVELTEKGMIFDSWWRFLYRLFKIETRKTGEEPKLWKVLIGCERCVAGQIALWSCVFLLDIEIKERVFYTLFSISFAIITTKIIRKWN